MKKKIITISVIAILSIVFWGAVALSQEYITTIKVKIAFTDLPKNYSVGYSSLEESFLQIKGKGWELAKLSMSSVEEFYVSANRRAGRHRKDLSDFIKSNQWVFPSMQVIQISPSQIEFDVDRVSSKVVNISKNFAINFKNGYGAISEVILDPSKVEISGSAILLQKIDSISIEKLELNNISENLSIDLNLEKVSGIKYSVNTVKLDMEVQKIVDKSFLQIPVVVKNVPMNKDLILYPAKVDLILRGGISKLGRLSNDSLKVHIDYWDVIKAEGGTIEPEIVIPKFVELISAEPKKLEYIIKQ